MADIPLKQLPDPWHSQELRTPDVVPSSDAVAGDVVDADAYEVYAAMLASHDMQGVVFSTTLGERGWQPSLSLSLPPEWQSVLVDFNDVNRRPWRLLPREPFVGKWQLASRDEIRNGPLLGLTDELRWDRILPGARGKLQVSAVGFNPERTRAIVDASYYAGGRCGQNGYTRLEKRNGRWQVLEGWESDVIC
jgi:hypothetical protein